MTHWGIQQQIKKKQFKVPCRFKWPSALCQTFFRLFRGFGPGGPENPCKWPTGSPQRLARDCDFKLRFPSQNPALAARVLAIWLSQFQIGGDCAPADEEDSSRFVAAIPQIEVLAKFVQEIGEKCGEILAIFVCRFSSFKFQGKCPQEISQNILDIFHSAPNRVFFFFLFFSLLQLWGLGGPRLQADLWPELSKTKSAIFICGVDMYISATDCHL